jgi:hypothetical protein
MTRRIDAASARETRSCESCGQTFEPARTDALFCSAACRQRAYRSRRVGVADNPGAAVETGARVTDNSAGLEVISWRPSGICAHCGRQDGLVYLVQSPFKEVPNEVLHLHHAAAWFVAAARQVTRHCVQEEGSP